MRKICFQEDEIHTSLIYQLQSRKSCFQEEQKTLIFWQHHLFLFPLLRSLPLWLFTHLEGTTGGCISPALLILWCVVWAVSGSFDTLDFCFNSVWILSEGTEVGIYTFWKCIRAFFPPNPLSFPRACEPIPAVFDVWTSSRCYLGVMCFSYYCMFYSIWPTSYS